MGVWKDCESSCTHTDCIEHLFRIKISLKIEKLKIIIKYKNIIDTWTYILLSIMKHRPPVRVRFSITKTNSSIRFSIATVALWLNWNIITECHLHIYFCLSVICVAFRALRVSDSAKGQLHPWVDFCWNL